MTKTAEITVRPDAKGRIALGALTKRDFKLSCS
jgi:hypothetical protein